MAGCMAVLAILGFIVSTQRGGGSGGGKCISCCMCHMASSSYPTSLLMV